MPTFGGVSGISLTTSSQVQLTWAAPSLKSDQLVFNIYQSNPDSLPTSGGVEAGQINGQTITLFEGFSALPSQTGNLIGQSDGNALSYTLKGLLDQSKNYAFQVVATNVSNKLSDQNEVVLAVRGFGNIDYKGCLTAVGVDYQSIKITFDVPADVTAINVLRNGQNVYNSTDSTVTNWVDTGLSPGQTYVYTCNVVLGGHTLVGPAPINATTVAPFQTYKGCISATAVSANAVTLSFAEPPLADRVKIYRNNNLVQSVAVEAGSVGKTDVTKTLTDNDLLQGVTYVYTCAAVEGSYEHVGSTNATVTTLSSDPPTFAGIAQVTVLTPNSVMITWGANSGVPAAEFKVYATPGAAINYTTPAAILPVGTLSTTITGLGDQLPYSFAVRACTASSVCDTNTVVLNVPTSNGLMPDGGAPTTTGISAVAKAAGVVTVTAPWAAANGFVLFRQVGFYCDGQQAASTNLASYINTQIFPVTNVLQVPTSLALANMLNYQNQYCHFIVQDFDTQTRSNNSATAMTLNIGNLTPPVGFTGIGSLTTPTVGSLETTLSLGFTPIAVQSATSPHGAYQYLVYLLSGSGDPCTAGMVHDTLAAANFPPPTVVNYTISGLMPNTNYSACVKAADSDGNLDPNDNHLSRATVVRTPPLFSGLQAATYNVANVVVNLQWNAATPTVLPIGNYYVRFRMNSADLSGAGYTQIAVPTTNCSGATCTYSIVPANFPTSGIGNGGSLYAGVYACDNFNIVNTSEAANCTAITTLTTKQVTVPNLTPPANFAGISAVTNTVNGTRTQGVVQIS